MMNLKVVFQEEEGGRGTIRRREIGEDEEMGVGMAAEEREPGRERDEGGPQSIWKGVFSFFCYFYFLLFLYLFIIYNLSNFFFHMHCIHMLQWRDQHPFLPRYLYCCHISIINCQKYLKLCKCISQDVQIKMSNFIYRIEKRGKFKWPNAILPN